MPKKAVKKTSFGSDLIEGMKLVLAHQRGEIELSQVWPKPVDVKAIRKRVKMSQTEFFESVSYQQARAAGMGAGRAPARLRRTRVPDRYRERASGCAPGTRQRLRCQPCAPRAMPSELRVTREKCQSREPPLNLNSGRSRKISHSRRSEVPRR